MTWFQHNSASAKLKRVAASDAVDMHEGMEDSILNAAAVVLNPDVEAILYQPTRMDASATNTERNLELGCPVCGHDGGTLSSSLAHIQVWSITHFCFRRMTQEIIYRWTLIHRIFPSLKRHPRKSSGCIFDHFWGNKV